MADTSTKPSAAALKEQLQHVIDHPDQYAEQSQDIIKLSRKASAALEDPFNLFQRLTYCAMPLIAARIGQDKKIFQTLANSGQTALSSAKLADETKIHPIIMDSLLEYMSTQSMVDEDASGNYRASPLTGIFLSPLFVDGLTHVHDNCLPGFNGLNERLSHPQDSRTAFDFGQHCTGGFYKWLESHGPQQAAFHKFMEFQFASLPSWLDTIPFHEKNTANATPETPIFVDVGGGAGQQCEALLKKKPDIQGRIILQDRPDVLKKAITSDRVERMEYDYLTEQPIKGARGYYFRQILHNNDDATSLKILKNHVSAMTDESVLIFDEKILPDQRPEGGNLEYTAGLNLAMLSLFDALERKEAHWRKLLAEAGLKVHSITRFTDFGDGVIIAGKS